MFSPQHLQLYLPLIAPMFNEWVSDAEGSKQVVTFSWPWRKIEFGRLSRGERIDIGKSTEKRRKSQQVTDDGRRKENELVVMVGQRTFWYMEGNCHLLLWISWVSPIKPMCCSSTQGYTHPQLSQIFTSATGEQSQSSKYTFSLAHSLSTSCGTLQWVSLLGAFLVLLACTLHPVCCLRLAQHFRWFA